MARGGQQWTEEADSLEKALSRRPGLLGTGAEGTPVLVAGVLSGSTSLEGRSKRVSENAGPSPCLPPGHSHIAAVALVGVVFLILIFIRVLTGYLWESRHRGFSLARGRPGSRPGLVQHSRHTLVLIARHTVGFREKGGD